MYTDEGISGTNTKHREGFNRMIQDALDGKIDLIVTKSVSRFARNTVDSLTTIRKIYRLAAQGHSTGSIAKILTDDGDLTPSGKTVWPASTVKSILTNERYKGAALLQKKFTVDFLTKKTKINEGEVPQYYVEDSHPAIIEPADDQEETICDSIAAEVLMPRAAFSQVAEACVARCPSGIDSICINRIAGRFGVLLIKTDEGRSVPSSVLCIY